MSTNYSGITEARSDRSFQDYLWENRKTADTRLASVISNMELIFACDDYRDFISEQELTRLENTELAYARVCYRANQALEQFYARSLAQLTTAQSVPAATTTTTTTMSTTTSTTATSAAQRRVYTNRVQGRMQANTQKALKDHAESRARIIENYQNGRPQADSTDRQMVHMLVDMGYITAESPFISEAELNAFNNSVTQPPLAFTVGHVSDTGRRRSNQDAHFVLEMENGVLAGVFDGHTGGVNSVVAETASSEFERRFPAKLAEKQGDVHAAFSEVIEEIEVVLRGLKYRVWDGTERNISHYDGSTAVISYVNKTTGEVITATLGDSEANIYRELDGRVKSIPLSPIRNPDYEKDANFARTRGCNVSDGRIGPLNVSRSFGDHAVLGIQKKPKISSFQMRPGDILVLACDGLKDYAPENQIVSIVRERGATSSPQELVDALKTTAIANMDRYGGGDNVTVIAIKADPAPAAHIQPAAELAPDIEWGEFVSAAPVTLAASQAQAVAQVVQTRPPLAAAPAPVQRQEPHVPLMTFPPVRATGEATQRPGDAQFLARMQRCTLRDVSEVELLLMLTQDNGDGSFGVAHSEIIPNLHLGNTAAKTMVRNGTIRGISQIIAVGDKSNPTPRNASIPEFDIENGTGIASFMRIVSGPSFRSSDESTWFKESFDKIDEALNQGKQVLIQGDSDSSNAVVLMIAYLMKRFSVPYEKAHAWVYNQRPIISVKSEMQQFLEITFARSLSLVE